MGSETNSLPILSSPVQSG